MESKIKRVIDVLMTTSLMCLMAYQVTGEVAHEYIGMLMAALVIVHQILNRKWYGAILKGKYSGFRVFNTITDILLLVSFALTAISGIAMSSYAVPFLYNLINVNTARVMHLAFSYWSLILMGIHLGCHIDMMTAKIPRKVKLIFAILATIIAGYGFHLFLKSNILSYITFKTHFAFLDYDKRGILIFFENIAMLTFFASIAHHIGNILRNISNKKYNKFLPIIFILATVLLGFIDNLVFK